MYSNLELLRHIKDEVDFVLTAVKGKSESDLLNDGVLCRAVVRSLEVIGEAAKKIDDDFKYQYAEIEWKRLAGTRDKLIHDYFGIDYEIVWNIIQAKLPELQYFINEIIKDHSNPPKKP